MSINLVHKFFYDPKISTNQLPKKIANAVLSDASKRAGLAVNSLKITQSTQKTFSNSCVFNFGEVCAQNFDPITQGWEVIVKVKSQFWTYHVDITGTRIVFLILKSLKPVQESSNKSSALILQQCNRFGNQIHFNNASLNSAAV